MEEKRISEYSNKTIKSIHDLGIIDRKYSEYYSYLDVIGESTYTNVKLMGRSPCNMKSYCMYQKRSLLNFVRDTVNYYQVSLPGYGFKNTRKIEKQRYLEPINTKISGFLFLK